MSGKKRIQVDESEWYRIQRQAQQLKEVQRNLPQLLDEVRAQTRADIDRTFAAVQQRQRRNEELVRGLSDQTRQLEADTTRRLAEQADRLQRGLDAAAGRLREDTRRLAEQQDALRQAIEDERAERRAALGRLSDQIREQAEDRARAEEMARTWLADARVMAGLVEQTLPHQRYAPGELDRLVNRLATAEQTAAQGRFEAALATAQEAYHSLSELRVDVEQQELERCSAQSAAVESLVRVERLIAGNLRRPVLGPDGTTLEGITLDVTYWSEGELDALRQETGDALSRARDDATDAGALRDLRELEAPRLEQVLGDVVERAGMRHLASQIRVNLADAVACTLSEYAYYDLVDGEYQDADPRGAYYAKLRHPNGNEIVLDICQAARDSGECVVRVLSYDHDTTSEADLRDRAGAIEQALAAQGHLVSAPVSEPGTPDPAMLDIARNREGPQRYGERPPQGPGAAGA